MCYHRASAKPEWSRRAPGSISLARAHWQCPVGLRSLPRQDALADEPGGLLSAFRRLDVGRADVCCRLAFGHPYCVDSRSRPPSALLGCRLALVPRDFSSGNWLGAGRRSSYGGPLHLRAADWPVPDADLGCERPGVSLATAAPLLSGNYRGSPIRLWPADT